MVLTGTDNPLVVDLVTSNETQFRLIIVQVSSLSEENALAFQEKLRNYLSYALNGQLRQECPDAASKEIIVRVDLHAVPTIFGRELLRTAAEAVAEYGIGWETSDVTATPNSTLHRTPTAS